MIWVVERRESSVGPTAAKVGLAQSFVFHFEGGKAKEVWVTPFDQAAADAFWSA